MVSLRVLVLESHSFQRNVMVMQLQKLGMSEVLQAEQAEQAMAWIELSGCIDIVLCDLAMQGGDALQFLRRSSQAGMVRSVVQCGELEPELRRGLGQLLALMGVRLLGELETPPQPQLLQRVLKRYSH
ncbi:response regulator [Pseudomonas sp. Fl4BN1]|uniref:response regulator n=1 Tax=Pseudomonas sp. Fl4BN1 TaxID=2697651 RepID=UPI001377ED44|nr:response regulator [Pseudomonas sp. Fl4BN1]NBF11493.1 response regulator [Pseudomonas sp. Fl4BN1]